MLNKTDYYFLKIVEVGNLNKAAEQLYVSQPSLSKYIQRLERQLGTSLFDRSVTPMRLNAAGQLYYRHLMDMKVAEQSFLSQLDEINRMERGTLRLGIPSYCGQCYLPTVIQQFNKRYPSVSLSLLESHGKTLERALLNQQIDLAIVHLPVSSNELYYQELFSENILLAVQRQNIGTLSTPELRSSSIYRFSEYSFILPHPDQQLGQVVANMFCQTSFKPEVRLRSENVFTMLSLCSLGVGACFVPMGGLSSLPASILNKVIFYQLDEFSTANWKLIAMCRKGYQYPRYTAYFIELFSQYGRITNLPDRHWMADAF